MQDDFKVPTGPLKPAPTLKPTAAPKSIEPAAPLTFKTPEQISGHEAAAATPLLVPTPLPLPAETTKRKRFALSWPPTRQQAIVASIVVAVVAFTGTGYMLLNKPATTKTATPVAAVQKPEPPKITTVPAALSGLPVQPELNQRPVVGVMIENSKAARPQAGLSQAGVIFEAIAEGGITRFLALYQDQQPGNIGPIRSARPYYVQWNESFRAAYVHAGGSQDALANIKTWGVQDLNQFAGGPFRREPSRSSPHNLYSSVVDLSNIAVQRGYKSEFTSLARKAAAPLTAPSASVINFNISSALYNSQFEYDAATNGYKRSQAGAPQIDANTNTQLTPNVVIAMVMPLGGGSRTSQGSAYSNYNPIGSGQAYIFQDGGVTVGNWNKADNRSQITFSDQAGAPIALNPGQTWLTALASNTKVTYR